MFYQKLFCRCLPLVLMLAVGCKGASLGKPASQSSGHVNVDEQLGKKNYRNLTMESHMIAKTAQRSRSEKNESSFQGEQLFNLPKEQTELFSDPNYYSGSDSTKISHAIQAAAALGGVVRIKARQPDGISDRTFWLIDEAIILPGNTTIIIENCMIKLSDSSRDNFIRSANCGIGITEISPLHNIHIIGIGNAVLQGADRPRATGDRAKKLGEMTYGTDAGKKAEHQKGDWRNIGILLAEIHNFSIHNLTVRDSHCWAISLEYCSQGNIRNLQFFSNGKKLIDGKNETILNQDGLDLRRGCHDILIDSISGYTGDDLVAFTAIKPVEPHRSGEFNSTMVSSVVKGNDKDDIYNVVLRNVKGYSAGGHHIVRFLNASGIKMHNIILDGLLDTSPQGFHCKAAIKIGDSNPAWGGVTPLGDTSGFIITNIQAKSTASVLISGSLTDSIINNVINYNPQSPGLVLASGAQNVRNVITNSIVTLK